MKKKRQNFIFLIITIIIMLLITECLVVFVGVAWLPSSPVISSQVSSQSSQFSFSMSFFLTDAVGPEEKMAWQACDTSLGRQGKEKKLVSLSVLLSVSLFFLSLSLSFYLFFNLFFCLQLIASV